MDIRKKLAENGGVYWMNMANPEEAEFVLQRMGGRELLEDRFPAVYQAYRRTVEHARKSDGGMSMEDKVSVNTDTSYEKSGTGTKFAGSISGFVCDPAIRSEDIGLAAPRPWKNVSVNLTIEDEDDPSRPPFASVTRSHKNVNAFSGEISTRSEVSESIVGKTNLTLITEFHGLDPDNQVHTGFFSGSYVNHVEDGGIKIVDRIVLDDPKYKNNSNNKPIIMLYGRKATANPDYKNADYTGGEYEKNNGGEQGDKSLKTLMPVKGTIVFREGYEFSKLMEPKEGRPMYRPTISLNSSQIVKYYQDEWKGDDPGRKMYDAVKDCFKADKNAKNVCNFDLKMDGSVDWKADLKDAGRYIKDNTRVLDYQVDAAFRLEVLDPDKMPNPVTLIIRYTDDPAVDLYASYNGDSTVYIPAVRVYWGCMAGDSSIRTSKGEKPVSEIESGDQILTVNGDYVTVAQILSEKEEKIYRIKTQKGSIGLTRGHPVLLKGGEERNASDLERGDLLLMQGQETAEILEVGLEDYGEKVYNLLIQESDEGTFFFANGFAVGDTDAQNRPLRAAPTEYTEEELKLQEEFGQLWEYRKKNG